MDDNIIFCAFRCSVREPKIPACISLFKNEMNLPIHIWRESIFPGTEVLHIY